MLKIPKEIYEDIVSHAKQQTPIEACGYLAGLDDVVKKIYKMKNTDNSKEHFSFDPKEQFEAFKDANKQGLRLIACYHSHPKTPARPSEEDIKLAYDPNISYVIVSLADLEPDVKSFKIKKGEVAKEDMEILI
jgi:proteasome lid subunit RPN8/RPN11